MGIVILAQMAQENVTQGRMPETLDCGCALVIAQMSASLHYPHLQFICVSAAHEHVHVIIGFYDYRIRFAGELHGLIRDTSYVSHDKEIVAVYHYRIANCLGGIVRHREIAHLHPGNFIPLPLHKHLPACSDGRCSERMTRKGLVDGFGGIYWL